MRSTLGTAVAVALHLAAFAFTLTAREPLHLLDTTVALDIIADEPTNPSAPATAAAPAPEPEPEIVKPPPPPAPLAAPKPPEDDEDPYEEDDSPPPAQAAQIITAPSEPAAPEPDNTFASGTSTAPAFGLVAGDGTGNGATFDPRARTGAAPKAKPAPIAPTEPISYRAPDLSRPATYMGMTSDCDFPSEAPAGMDTATVQVAVTVDASGKPLHAEVVRDLGYGFGRAARACALRQMYRAGRDASGRPALTKTPPIRVKFIR